MPLSPAEQDRIVLIRMWLDDLGWALVESGVPSDGYPYERYKCPVQGTDPLYLRIQGTMVYFEYLKDRWPYSTADLLLLYTHLRHYTQGR